MSNFESDSAKLLQIVLTGQPELREVLNNPELRQLKQRVALRCEIKPLPNIEETEKYVKSRLLTAGAQRTDVFTQSALDYVFRCSEGIPRQINNLCDNALLAGYAAGEPTVTRAIIEDVADTFDMLPRAAAGRPVADERESPARIFDARGRAELWSAGNGGDGEAAAGSDGATPRAAREAEREVPRAFDVNDIGAAFRRWDVMGER
jgi:general secretion pathway protein A